MNRTRVTSSLLRSVGYDPATKVLEVEFLRRNEEDERRVYQYSNVSPERNEELMTAKSTGSFFLKMIKPNHQCKRIEEKREEEKEASSKTEKE